MDWQYSIVSSLVGDSEVNMALQGELGWKLNTTRLLCKSCPCAHS